MYKPSARRLLVGGNWKCNGTLGFASQFPTDVLQKLSFNHEKVDVVVCPSLMHLTTAQAHLADTHVQVGAQNISMHPNGAYTGELSAEMLTDAQVPWVILGHSERRHVFGESDEVVGRKVKRALDHELSVMACIGEKIEERQSGKTNEVNARQLEAILRQVTDDWTRLGAKMVIAYEPVWAIGTGVVATPEQAQEAHDFVRGWIKSNISERAANDTRILYGGSVTEKNADELIKCEDIDGFLVGGASLKPAFHDIVAACHNHSK